MRYGWRGRAKGGMAVRYLKYGEARRARAITARTSRLRLDCWGDAERESSWGLSAAGAWSWASVVCVGDIWRRGFEANGNIVRMVGPT